MTGTHALIKDNIDMLTREMQTVLSKVFAHPGTRYFFGGKDLFSTIPFLLRHIRKPHAPRSTVASGRPVFNSWSYYNTDRTFLSVTMVYLIGDVRFLQLKVWPLFIILLHFILFVVMMCEHDITIVWCTWIWEKK